MSEVYLTKVGVIYMSSSGPDTRRYIVFKNKSLILNEECIIEYNVYSKPPVQTSITISEEATNSLNEYASAFEELQKAQLKFTQAKKTFKASTGGKEIDAILHPQQGQLMPSDVFNEDDINVLIKEIENKGDCKVTSTFKEVEGYNAGNVKFSLSKPVLLDRLDKITMGDYTYAKHGYVFKYENGKKIVEKAVFQKAGRQYPPYRDDDYYEVEAGEMCKLEQMEKEQTETD